jgi:hypothetical protein
LRAGGRSRRQGQEAAGISECGIRIANLEEAKGKELRGKGGEQSAKGKELRGKGKWQTSNFGLRIESDKPRGLRLAH